MDRRELPALAAIVLSDGRPGHFNLADGILTAAQRVRHIDVVRIDVKRGYWPGFAAAAWSNSGLAADKLISTVYGLDAAKLPRADLIVSAGAETLAANAACARLTGAANVFYGSLRRFTPESFDLVLTSYPAQAIRPRHALMLKSSPASSFAFAGRTPPVATPPKRIALLIGGGSGETTFSEHDWAGLLKLVEDSGRAGIRWMVTNSRRTPDGISDQLQALSARPASAIETFVDVRKPAPSVLGEILLQADAALVTDESSSMVSDAVTAGLPTLGIFPRLHAMSADERDYRAHLAAGGWYRARPIASTTAAVLLAEFAKLTPMRTDVSASLAAVLTERIPRLFGTPTLLR